MSRSYSTVSIVLLALPVAALWGALWLGSDPLDPTNELVSRTYDRLLQAKLEDIGHAAGGPALPVDPGASKSAELDSLRRQVEAAPEDARPTPETIVHVAALLALEGDFDAGAALLDAGEVAVATTLSDALRRAANGGPPLDRGTLDAAVAAPGTSSWLRAQLALRLAESAGTPEAHAAAVAEHDAVLDHLVAMGLILGAAGATAGLVGLVLLGLAPWRLRRWLASRRSRSAPFDGGARTAAVVILFWFLAHAFVGVGLSLLFVRAAGLDPGEPVVLASLLVGSSTLSGLAGLVLIAGLALESGGAREPGLLARLGFVGSPSGRDVRWALGAVAVAVPGVIAGSLLNGWLLGPEPLPPAIALLASDPGPVAFGLLTLATLVLAPLFEEAVFRGYLYPVLRGRFGIAIAAVLSGAAFAIVHVQPGNLIPLWTLGALFALAREATGTLWAPVLAHALWNGSSLAVASFVFG